MTWLASDSVRLPWKQYDRQAGRMFDRCIFPDATLEIPHRQRRLFLECEMGTNPLASPKSPRAGAIGNKIERYDEFVAGLADPAARITHYEKQFADKWKCKLVFLVPSIARKMSILDLRRQLEPQRRIEKSIQVEIYTFQEAKTELFRYVWGENFTKPEVVAPGPDLKPSTLVFSVKELAEIKRFYVEAMSSIQKTRHRIRELKTSGLDEPKYPPNAVLIDALMRRFQ